MGKQLKAVESAYDSLTQRKTIPLRWELQMGCNYLTNTKWAGNKPLQDIHTLSGAFYTFLDLPSEKPNASRTFLFRIGIGANIQTFGMDKQIAHVGNRTIFVAFKPDQYFCYSYFQQLFIDLPLSIALRPFKNSSFEMETGGVIGYQVYSEYRFCIRTLNGNIVETEEHVANLNPFHYGISGKLRFRPRKRRQQLSFTLSGNYYLSELFIPSNETPTKNFSILAGIGISVYNY